MNHAPKFPSAPAPKTETIEDVKKRIHLLAEEAKKNAIGIDEYNRLLQRHLDLSYKKNNTPAEIAEKNSILRKFTKATLGVKLLEEFRLSMKECGLDEAYLKDTLAHENAHANKAESLREQGEKVSFKKYGITFLKDPHGNFAYQPHVMTGEHDTDMQKNIDNSRKVTNAPVEYSNGKFGDVLSPGDLAILDRLDQQEKELKNHSGGHDEKKHPEPVHHEDPHAKHDKKEHDDHHSPEHDKDHGAHHDDHGDHKEDKNPLGKKESFVRRGAVVDTTSLMESQARDDANRQMTESKEDRSAGWLKKTWTRMWKHNIAQDYYRQKHTVEARKNILANKNLYANEAGSKGLYEEAMKAVHTRFISDYKNELLIKGEEHQVIGENPQINALIKSYGSGKMTEGEFETEKTKILTSIRKDYADQEKLFTDNLLQYANELRQMCEQGKKINDMDVHVEITLGKAKERLSTEAHLHGFDRVWNKIKNTGIGRVMGNEAAASLVGAAVYSAGKFFGLKALRSKVGQWLTFGGTAVAAGAVVAANESRRLEQERAQHSRERAKGMRFEGDDLKRREHMEGFMYRDVRDSREIIDYLMHDREGLRSGALDATGLQLAFKNLVDLEARFKMGEERKIDLVRYSDSKQLEIERTELDLLRAEIKCAMRARHLGGTGVHFDGQFQREVENQMNHLLKNEGGVEQTDKCFKKMKLRRSAMKGLSATVLGGVVGAVGQELYHSVLPTNTDSLSSGLWHGHHGQDLHKTATPLESLHRWWAGNNPRVPTGTPHEFICGNTHLQLPEGVNIVDHGDGNYDILNGDQKVAENIKLMFDQNGNLTEETKQALAGHDIYTDNFTTGQKIQESPSEYIKNHSHGTTRMHRSSESWLNNQTPKFDENELRADWGGVNGTGVDTDGNYVLDVSRMTSDGSWNDSHTVDALQKMHDGQMKMAFSISRDTQHDVFMVPVGPDGKIQISPDSEVGKLLFKNINGKAVFQGKFMEVVAANGAVAKDGGSYYDIFASNTGKGLSDVSFDSTVQNVRFNIPASTDTEIPLYTYARPRRPLEKGEYAKEKPKAPSAPKDPHAQDHHDHPEDKHPEDKHPEDKKPQPKPEDKKPEKKPEQKGIDTRPEPKRIAERSEVFEPIEKPDPEPLKKKENISEDDAKKRVANAEKEVSKVQALVDAGVLISDDTISAVKEELKKAKEALKEIQSKKNSVEDAKEFVKNNPGSSKDYKNLSARDEVFLAGKYNGFFTIDEMLDDKTSLVRFIDKKTGKWFDIKIKPDLVYLKKDIDSWDKTKTKNPEKKELSKEDEEKKNIVIPPLPPLEDLLKEQFKRASEKGLIAPEKPKRDYLAISNILNGLPKGKIKALKYENIKKGQKYFVDGDKKREATFLKRDKNWKGEDVIRFEDKATGRWFVENVSEANVYLMSDVEGVLEGINGKPKTDAQNRIEDAKSNLERLAAMDIASMSALDRNTLEYAKTEYANRLKVAEADREKEIEAEKLPKKGVKKTIATPSGEPAKRINSTADVEKILVEKPDDFKATSFEDFKKEVGEGKISKDDRFYIRAFKGKTGTENLILAFDHVEDDTFVFKARSGNEFMISKEELKGKTSLYQMSYFEDTDSKKKVK